MFNFLNKKDKPNYISMIRVGGFKYKLPVRFEAEKGADLSKLLIIKLGTHYQWDSLTIDVFEDLTNDSNARELLFLSLVKIYKWEVVN